MDEFFNDTWDISMSTVPDFGNENKTFNNTFNSILNYLDNNAANLNKSTFFNLPNYVRALILKYKGIENLYDWQEKCLNLPAVEQRQNLVYSLPTSGGKTLVAEILMLRELLINKKNVIFVLPYVALAQEKVRSLSPFGLDLEFYVEEYVGGKGKYPPTKHKKKSVYVCTIEKAAGLIESLLETNRLEEVGMMVVDEIHLIGDPSRGPVLEMMLSKLMYVTKNVHIIAMSATVGNLNEIGQFLNAQLYTHDFRPVELIEYVKCENKVYKIERNTEGNCNLVLDRILIFNYDEEMKKIDPAFLGGLVHEVIPEESCLVFCPTKKLCSHFAMLICRTSTKHNLKDLRKEEKLALLRALNEEGQGNVCSVLKKTVAYGVAYHHSGLTNAERKLLEEAFISGTLSCICCTSTLAAGVNLPAKRVIMFSPYVGRDFLKLSTYKQMSGRAGRMGLTSAGESFLVCEERDMSKVLDLLKSPMDRCESKLVANNFMHLTMGAIGLKIATSKSDLEKLHNCTLSRIQNRNTNNIEQTVDHSIDQLNNLKAIKKGENDEFILTTIASAALAANLDIGEAKQVYDDLFEAVDRGLLLSNYLHLFYLVTPYSALEEVKLERQIYIAIYSELSGAEKKVAERIGITEVCVIQYIRDGRVKAISETVFNRFILSMIIFDLWNKNSVWDVSNKFNVPRGTLHNFLMRTAAFASSLQRFTEALKMDEFECFPALLQKIIPRISYCCTSELLHLMQLPAVKIGRAKQLYKAGYKNLQDLANADPLKLVASVDHLPRKVAYEIVAASKLLMLEKAETLQEEADNIKAELKEVRNMAELTFADICTLPDDRLSTPRPKKLCV